MLVILDANVIVSDPMLRGSIWPQLTDAISGGRVEVLLPRLALEEAIAAYRRLREAKAVEIQAAGRRASRGVQKHLDRAVAAALREAKRYPKRVRDALSEVGVTVLDAPQVSHYEVARRAIDRKRPFDDAGSGYRDALHWMSVLEIVDRRYEDNDSFSSARIGGRSVGAESRATASIRTWSGISKSETPRSPGSAGFRTSHN
ncbi:PIN domain-containing protein [Microbacterium sp. QXD-8]|uniref:PIN domain-containing protein n=1 Tax=Microbacterium psychrotolerans TaxID=3068321 RepID=A0ABU0YYL1_9MICO|nr:PIN domain-containing protein [Microbacterium sp. QXD-8]MDQ7877429.1 PIN domain-containing protein [Microbacterium sp. QXD-8]